MRRRVGKKPTENTHWRTEERKEKKNVGPSPPIGTNASLFTGKKNGITQMTKEESQNPGRRIGSSMFKKNRHNSNPYMSKRGHTKTYMSKRGHSKSLGEENTSNMFLKLPPATTRQSGKSTS